MAAGKPDLDAGVAYYGAQPPAEQVPSIKAALLLHYAGLDQRINAGIPAYEAALKANGKRYTIYVYPGVNHAFNNDTGDRYDKAAADLAWSRTIAFFKRGTRRAAGVNAARTVRERARPASSPCASSRASSPRRADELHADRHAALAAQQRQRQRRQPGQRPQRAEHRIAGRRALRRDAGRRRRDDRVAICSKISRDAVGVAARRRATAAR